jgi:aminotransferase in exopolysaccharide biosynthesis
MSEPLIPLSEPTIGGNAQRYLEECLATNFVSSVGPFVDRFEREFAAYVGARFAVACSSGTAALHVAFRLLGIGPDDEVFVPSLTFIASANPVAYERGRIVLVDSERETWNMDPALVIDELERRARAGRKQPRAIELVHILGHPAQIDDLVDACARHGVALVEDASEALGARWTAGRHAGKHVGTVGQLGCFSFNGNKVITTGGGGMITTDDEALARRAKHLTTQARLPGPEYRHDEVGYNYRLPNLAAALGVAQLEQLPDFLAKKRAIAERYDAAWRRVPGVTAPPQAAWASSSCWLYSVLIDPARYGCDRQALFERLGQRAIQTRPIWSPLHTQPMYQDAPRLGGQVAESLFAQGLSLPCSVSLDAAAQERVIDAITAIAG